MTVFSAFLINHVIDNSKENFDSVAIEKRSTTILIYSDGLDEYITIHPAFNGEVTTLLTLPQWLGRDDSIKAYAENGKGYVFTDNKPGLMSQVINQTNNSSQLGVSNQTQIITNAGSISKPTYIPNNSLVYMR